MRPFSTHQAIPLPLWDLSKGLYFNVPTVKIPDGGTQYAKDVFFFEGRVYPRFPFREYAEAPNNGNTEPINGIYGAFFLGSSQFIMRSRITAGLINVDYYAGPWTDITPVGLAGSLAQPPSACQFKQEFIFCPGADAVQKWTGSGNMVSIDSLQPDADLQPPDVPYYVTASASNLFLGNGIVGGQRDTTRVWWCSHRDSNIWNTTGSGNPLQYTAGYTSLEHEPSEISGMAFHGGRDVIALKRSSLYKATWVGMPVGFRFDPITVGIGCLSQPSVKFWRDIMIWLGTDFNVYAMPFRGQIQPIGDSVRKRIEQLLDLSKSRQAVAQIDTPRGVYRIFMPDAYGVCKTFLDCNLATGAWSEGEILASGISIMSASEYRPGYSRSRSLYGSLDGKIYTHYGESAVYRNLMDGTATTGNYGPMLLTGVFDAIQFAKQAGETMELHAISLQGEYGAATPVFRVGDTIKEILGAQIQTMTEIDLDGVEDRTYSATIRSESCRFMQVGIYWESGESVPMVLDGITAWVKPRGDVR